MIGMETYRSGSYYDLLQNHALHNRTNRQVNRKKKQLGTDNVKNDTPHPPQKNLQVFPKKITKKQNKTRTKQSKTKPHFRLFVHRHT